MAAVEKCPIAKMQTLVVASDGSEYSEGAVREAIRWSQQYGSKLCVVCTAQVTLGQLQYAAEVVSEIDKAARQTCEAVKSRAQAAGVKCESIVHEGEEPYEHIVSEAQKQKADAIVIGRRGRRGLMKLLMGSVTHLVIGHAPCNVFVVPRPGNLTAKRLLVATDGSGYSEKAAMQAISLARRTKGSIIACSVVHGGIDADMAKENVAWINNIASSEGVGVEAVICYGTAYLEIIDAAKAHDADLIVVGSHGRTGITSLLMGSISERVVGMSDRTVMVVR
ncbi:MAG: universal stress protein [Gammaproteobacteria bacterium]|nr:universal stress protein [Gammaproteobacteria bacterium]